MARINPNEIDKFQTGGQSEFFSLKNDKDVATVHFLAEDLDDLDIFVVHKVKDGERTRYVSCLRAAGDPIDNCPLCASGVKPEVRIFAQMYDVKDEKIKIWDRGKTFLKLLEPFARRVKPLWKKPFEIERNGAAGDIHTTYSIFALEPDETLPEMTEDTLPERVEISAKEGALVLEKTFEELQAYVTTGSLGGQDATPTAPHVSRRENTTASTPRQPSLGKRRIY